jgi:hypothetical protein
MAARALFYAVMTTRPSFMMHAPKGISPFSIPCLAASMASRHKALIGHGSALLEEKRLRRPIQRDQA